MTQAEARKEFVVMDRLDRRHVRRGCEPQSTRVSINLLRTRFTVLNTARVCALVRTRPVILPVSKVRTRVVCVAPLCAEPVVPSTRTLRHTLYFV